MRARSAILAAALAGSIQPVFAAASPLLNFEDLATNQPLQVGTRYQGVEFSSNAWIVSGGFRGDAFDPGARALRLAVDPTDRIQSGKYSFTMSFAGGFIDRVGFAVSTWLGRGGLTVQLKDDLGEVIEIGGAQALAVDETDVCPAGVSLSFCNWRAVEFGFKAKDGRTAQSITFTGNDQRVLLDNLSFIVPDPATNGVPEPTGLALSLAALAALGLACKRRQLG